MATNFAELMRNNIAECFGGYDTNTNLSKLLRILERQMQDLEFVFEQLSNNLDIDQSENDNLDIFLSNLSLTRSASDDEEVRSLVKTEINANFSKGQVSTLREIAEVVLGNDGLNGIEESWNNAQFTNEIAGIILRISTNAENRITIPSNTIEKAVAGGISTFYSLIENDEIIIVQEPDVSIRQNIFLRTGTFESSREMGVIL